jgi:hypothetical protein
MGQLAMLIDTPNIFNSVHQQYGPRARPDYRVLRFLVEGWTWQGRAFVNDGVSANFPKALQGLGYQVVESHARDVDEVLIAHAVDLCGHVDCVVLCSGDGDYTPLVRLLRQAGVRVVVAAIFQTCSRELAVASDGLIEFPVMFQAA